MTKFRIKNAEFRAFKFTKDNLEECKKFINSEECTLEEIISPTTCAVLYITHTSGEKIKIFENHYIVISPNQDGKTSKIKTCNQAYLNAECEEIDENQKNVEKT